MKSGSYKFIGEIEAQEVFGPVNLTGTPERNLLMAIMVRAILDVVGNDQREAEEAEDWLFGGSAADEDEPYTFPWLCQQLDLDRFEIAAKIKAMPKRGNRRIAPWYFQKNGETQLAC